MSPPCRHGFPQAFAFHPVGYKISSGLFRLSCPLLVKAIDKLEEDGGLEDVNDQLEVDVDLRQVQFGSVLCNGLGRGQGRLALGPDLPCVRLGGENITIMPCTRFVQFYLQQC